MMLRLPCLSRLLVALLAAAACVAAHADGVVGTSLPADFPVIEDTSLVSFKASGNRLLLDVTRRAEIAFVKTVAIDGEPAQYRIELGQVRSDASPQASERPTQSHMHHVDVRLAHALSESAPAVFAPRCERVEQGQSHGCAFESETS